MMINGPRGIDAQISLDRMKRMQPKAIDAAEVEHAKLMRVPKRYAFRGAVDAYRKGIPILARSEHPSEATGDSGINPTVSFGEPFLTTDASEAAFKKSILGKTFLLEPAKSFCESNNINFDAHVRDLSWTYWRKIPGLNLSVLKDSSIPNRYWIIEEGASIYLVEGREVIQAANAREKSRALIEKHTQSIIDDYEKVSNHFGHTMAWIVEMQLDDKKEELYFLQRHPTRHLEQQSWEFESPPEKHEIVVTNDGRHIVRGMTSKEGMVANMIYDSAAYGPGLPQQEIASDLALGYPVQLQRHLKNVNVYLQRSPLHSKGGSVSDNHSVLIPFAKPQVFIALPNFKQMLSKEMRSTLVQKQREKHARLFANYDQWAAAAARGEMTQEEKTQRDRIFRSNPENLLQLRVGVRSNGKEARIKILEVL